MHYPVKDLRHPASCYSWHFVLSLFIHWLCLMKYLRFILFFAFFIITRVSVAQQIKVNNDSLFNKNKNKNKSDSLKRLITGAPDDTLKVLRLIALSQQTTEFASQILSLSEKLHFTHGIAWGYESIGSIYQLRKDYKTAIKYYQQAIDLSEAAGNYSGNDYFYPGLLNSYFYLGDYPGAMQTISREMTVAEKTNNKRRIAHCNNILGYIYFKQENFNEAEKYYNLYINNAKELKDSVLLAHALGELADVYIAEKKYTQSINALFTTIQICDHLSAYSGIQNIDTFNTDQYKRQAIFRLGKTYKLAGDLPRALEYSLNAIQYETHIPLPEYELASYYINAGDVYKELKEYKKAIDYLSYGFTLSGKMEHHENTRDAAEYLSQTYALQHRYDSAFYFYQLFTGLKDSIVNNETKMKIAGIQGQYDIAKKDKEIAREDKEIAREQQIRNILVGSFIFLLIVILLIYNSYRLKQKNKYQQENNRHQNELFNAIVSTQDLERKRIAQDIHDSLGSVLSAAKLKLSSLEESKKLLSADQQEKYQSTLGLLDEASTELRNISHNIMPATLSKLGIVAALQNLIDKISSHAGLQISFTAHEFEVRIEETAEISIYRIILELINNIVKHAAANKVTIQLIKYPAYINLTVEDNGRGFNYNKAAEEKKGIGLGNIFSRVEYLKGTIDIDSSPGKGTTVIIDIPYKS